MATVYAARFVEVAEYGKPVIAATLQAGNAFVDSAHLLVSEIANPAEYVAPLASGRLLDAIFVVCRHLRGLPAYHFQRLPTHSRRQSVNRRDDLACVFTASLSVFLDCLDKAV